MKSVYDVETLAASHRADLLHEARQAALAQAARSSNTGRHFSVRHLVARLLRLKPAGAIRTQSPMSVTGAQTGNR